MFMTILVLPIAWAKAITTSWHVVTSVTPQTMRCTPSTHTFSSMPLIWMMSFFTSAGTRYEVSRLHSALIAAWTGKTTEQFVLLHLHKKSFHHRGHKQTRFLSLILILASNTEIFYWHKITSASECLWYIASIYDTGRLADGVVQFLL